MIIGSSRTVNFNDARQLIPHYKYRRQRAHNLIAPSEDPMPDMSREKAVVLADNSSAPDTVYTEALILLFQVLT